MLELDSKKHFF